MIGIQLDRVMLANGESVFDLTLTEMGMREGGNTIRARLCPASLKDLKYHIEGLLLDIEGKRNVEFAQCDGSEKREDEQVTLL